MDMIMIITVYESAVSMCKVAVNSCVSVILKEINWESS